jgi:hypothetical protein
MEAYHAFLNELVNRPVEEKAAALTNLPGSEGYHIPAGPDLFRILKYWFIEPGLRPYF